MESRKLGLIFSLLGLSLIGYFLLLLRDAAAGESITYSATATVLAPTLWGIGLVHLIGGERAQCLLGHPYRPTKVGAFLVLVLLGLGVWLLITLGAHLRGLGYKI